MKTREARDRAGGNKKQKQKQKKEEESNKLLTLNEITPKSVELKGRTESEHSPGYVDQCVATSQRRSNLWSRQLAYGAIVLLADAVRTALVIYERNVYASGCCLCRKK